MMRKRKLARPKDGSNCAKRPRNTMTLCLDGSTEEYFQSYNRYHAYYRYWNLCNAATRVRIGNRLLYTTPLNGTFYLVMKYKDEYIVFVIIARMAWLVGFCTSNGIFQMELEDHLGPYMDAEECQMTGFRGGHRVISQGQTGKTLLSLYDIRKGFRSIVQYKGANYPEPPEFRPSIGRIVVHLLEAKFREIYSRNCKAIENPNCSKLGQDFVEYLIVNWSPLCEEAMRGVVRSGYEVKNKGIGAFSNLWDILDGIFYLHIDGLNEGHFLHEPLPPRPRSLTWTPIDPGEGDIDIPLKVERVISCKPAGARKPKQIGTCSHKKRGLIGGGVGGPPVVPKWFLNWEQRDNEQQCDIVEQQLQLLGLTVKKQALHQSAPPPPQPASAPPLPPPTTTGKRVMSHHDATLFSSDVASLAAGNFLLDGVINLVMAHMRTEFADENLLLVSPSVASLLANIQDPVDVADTAQKLLLATRRMVLFPVNNSKRFDKADDGTHWSLLVLDNITGRFVHHDSMDGTNLPAARRLADALRPLLPVPPQGPPISGPTPQQSNGYDCGVYLLAVALAIFRWWKTRPSSGEAAHCWFQAVKDEVTADSVAAMRANLANNINLQLIKQKDRTSSSSSCPSSSS